MKIESLEEKNNRLEEKISQLEIEQNSLKIRLEVTKGQLSNQTDSMENEINDKKVMAAEKEFTAKQLLEVKNKLSKLENDQKEKDDNAMILECTLKNRDIEIKRLKTELEEVKYLNLMNVIILLQERVS